VAARVGGGRGWSVLERGCCVYVLHQFEYWMNNFLPFHGSIINVEQIIDEYVIIMLNSEEIQKMIWHLRYN
jgi:hypothetical protein